MQSIETEVIVVGAGPCGVTLANHLGLHGIRTILIDSSADILDYPRAVGVDDEALRSWQAVGLSVELQRDMVQNPPVRYHNSRGHCFAKIRPQAQPFGWARRNMFLQPLMEASLRQGLARYPTVKTMFGFAVSDVVQTDAGVAATCAFADTGGAGEDDAAAGAARTEPIQIRARYLVGADGGRSTVRRLVDVTMTGETDVNKWLVVDVENDSLDEPFSGVYCDPQRPHMSIDLPYGYRRFEFMLLPSDDEVAMQQPAAVERLISQHYPSGVPLPKIKRSRVYLHHSRIAERFQVGRVFLAGDAAHLQPPFFGQGMNSGIRDATNLGWKLAAVLHGAMGPETLASYGEERRDHALAMVNFATWIGRLYRPWNKLTERLRDAFFWAVQSVPSARDYVLQLRFKPMPKYTQGLVLADGHPAIGTMFMQPRVEMPGGAVLKLDDAIGKGFAVIGVNVDPAAHMSAEERAFWARLGAVVMRVNRSRAGKHLTEHNDPATLVVDDIEGKFRDWLEDQQPNDVVVLRPDRYVAAICRHSDLGAITARFKALVGAPEGARELQPMRGHEAVPSAVAADSEIAA